MYLIMNIKQQSGDCSLIPQIRALIRDGKFEDLLSQTEKSTWKSFKSFVKNFLGNRKAPNYREIVGELLQ